MLKFAAIVIIFFSGSFQVPDKHLEHDSLHIISTGSKNRIEINNVLIFANTSVCDSIVITGQVVQIGENNSVELSTTTLPKTKKQTNKISKIQVKQTGKNNTIKINSD